MPHDREHCVDAFDDQAYDVGPHEETSAGAVSAPEAQQMSEPTGHLSCGMPYWHPQGLTLDEMFRQAEIARQWAGGNCPKLAPGEVLELVTYGTENTTQSGEAASNG